MAAGTPRVTVDDATHEAVVAEFRRATIDGDLPGLMTVLDPDVTLTSDGGGKVRAALRSVHGADRVARLLVGLASQLDSDHHPMSVMVNGAPGFAILKGGEYDSVISLTVEDARITRVDMVRAPDKLATMPENSLIQNIQC